MKLFIVNDYNELSDLACSYIIETIKTNTNPVLGLATGGSPVGIYERLIDFYKKDLIDFSKVITFNLDEYVGLDDNNPQSYRKYMNDNLFNHVNIKMDNTYVPNGNVIDLESEVKRYNELLDSYGGVDIQLLGIGSNGHIGFNEPSETLSVGTHVVDLEDETIKANSRFFDSIDDVPKKAVTMGIGNIMSAKKIVLIASGKSKAKAIKELFSNKITTNNPSTLLNLHKDVIVIVDKEAASLL